MKYLQRHWSALLLLLGLLMTSGTLLAQEATAEATVEATPTTIATTTEAATPTVTATPTLTTTATQTATPTLPPTATNTPTATLTPSPTVMNLSGLRAAGSGLVLPLLRNLETASGASGIEYNIIGTTAGLAAFCSNEAAIAGSTRALSLEEGQICEGQGVDYLELMVAHGAVALIANPQDTFLTCLSTTDLDTIFAPSAVTTTNWTQVNPANTDLALKVALPASDTLAAFLLDATVKGEGFRRDATIASVGEIVTSVANTPGTLGVVDLQTALNALGTVNLVQVGAGANCAAPSANVIEGKAYPLALSFYLYINRANVSTLQPLLDFILTDSAAAPILNSGFTPASISVVETNRRVLSGELAGRVYSREVDEFQIPPNLAGNIEIAGAGTSFTIFKGAADSLTTNNQNFAINFKMEGVPAGVRRMCNGEVDILVSSTDLTPEQQNGCAANNVTPISLPIGTQAVVVIGHEGDTFSQCLTRDQIIKIWGAPATNTVKNWQAVDAAFGDVPMTLFGFTNSGDLGDLLLAVPNSSALPIREDTELSSDPLYRAAAVANVPGALTFMSWSDYQRVVANNQTRIQLVGIDGGAGCVQPSLETIQNGTYAFSQTLRLIVTQSALADIATQSYLWTVFSDAQVNGFMSQNLIGFEPNNLLQFRDNLQDSFRAAQTAIANAPAEATAEVTAEATSEATAEATQNAGN